MGESLVLGLALGGIVALFALGLAAFGSLLRTVRSPASLASPSWFAR